MEKTRDELVSIDEACANCGKRGGGAVKLKNCHACHLVKYCGVECQKAHRKQHKVACKMRAAELKDELLYSQGHERPEEDFCPICTLPIPLGSVNGLSVFFNTCCTKMICAGRELAAQKRGMFDCPFCRTPQPNNIADTMVMIQARVEKRDPAAINYLGEHFCQVGDIGKAVELWSEAAGLGCSAALYHLALSYDNGEGVQKDKAKATEFYKKAAMQGHVESRHNLGCDEGDKGNYDRAVKQFLREWGTAVQFRKLRRCSWEGSLPESSTLRR